MLKRFVSEDPIGVVAGPNFYAYVRGDPVSASDPSGLDTYTAMVGGSVVFGAGFAGYVGVYISNKPNDIGVVVQGEMGGGLDFGASTQVGWNQGGASTLRDPSVNYNASGFGGAVSVSTDPRTGDVTGVSIGPAPRAGASQTYARGDTYGMRDFFDWFFDRFGPKPKKPSPRAVPKAPPCR